jgi:peptide/nickel transport system ATP-binding protein
VHALTVNDLSVGYRRDDGRIAKVVASVSLLLDPGIVVGLSGESGCGKSTLALAAMGYRAPGAVFLGGRSCLGEVDLVRLGHRKLRAIWGREIAYVAQDASRTLNPSMRVASQLQEPLARHLGLRRAASRARQLELLESVAFQDPESILRRYPHQLSGGQQQRVAVALALACEPKILILDEPTTGLDVTTQAEFCALFKQLVARTGVAALYVSHDLALMATVASRLAVMYAGEVVEEGGIHEVCLAPRHPYTRALLDAAPTTRADRKLTGLRGSPPHEASDLGCGFAPRCNHAIDACVDRRVELLSIDVRSAVRCIRADELRLTARNADAGVLVAPAGVQPLLEVRGLVCAYGESVVVDDANLTLRPAETLGIVGESGSGKSTLLRAIVGLHPPVRGNVFLHGEQLHPRAVRRSRRLRRELQIVFQNPDSSLNPRQTVCEIIQRPIRLFRDDVPRAQEFASALDMLEAVKLPRALAERYPAELSGGQKQRVALARAFASRPAVLLCDEVTSALDVSVQAAIVELIQDLSRDFQTAVVFVSHDLGVVRAIASSAMVMSDGRICETGTIEQIFDRPVHPYTSALLRAIPELPGAREAVPAQADDVLWPVAETS